MLPYRENLLTLEETTRSLGSEEPDVILTVQTESESWFNGTPGFFSNRFPLHFGKKLRDLFFNNSKQISVPIFCSPVVPQDNSS